MSFYPWNYRCKTFQKEFCTRIPKSSNQDVISNKDIGLIGQFWSSSMKLALERGLSWSWWYGSWIHTYLCNQYLSPLMLWVWILLRQGVLDSTLWDKVCQLLAAVRWFSPGTPVSSTNKTDHHDITEILLKVASITITLTHSWQFYDGEFYRELITPYLYKNQKQCMNK